MNIGKTIVSSIAGLVVVVGCASQPAVSPAIEPIVDAAPVTRDEPGAANSELEKRPVLMADAVNPSTQPANDPQLPKGHPDISEMRKQQKAKSGPLPAGHPDINSAKSGMPKMPGKLPGPLPNLPAGHPDMSQMQQAAPSTQPAGALGVLKVRAVQGTKGGPAIGVLKVNVEMVLPDKTALDKFEAALGKDGTLVVEGLPTSKAFRPLVRINYGGVDYEAIGTPFDAEHISQDLEVKVYESTEQEPAWEVKMAHAMVEPIAADKLQVVQMLSVENPSDKAWIGKAGEDGKRTTLTLPLPPGASDVTPITGFHDCCIKILPDKVVNTMALNPGVTQFRIGYTVPVSAGKASLDFTTPSKVANMIVFLPDDATQVVAEGIEPKGKADMGNGSRRFFRAADLPAGQSVKLNLSNVPSVAPKAEAGQPAPATASSGSGASAQVTQVAKAIAGTGAILILLFGTAFLFTKSPKAKRKVA